MIEIVLQYFDGCPHWKTAAARIEQATAGIDGVVVRLQRIESVEAAVESRFHGSPTVLINGVDPFADESSPVGLSCRIYRTSEGLAGSPTFAELRDAITSAELGFCTTATGDLAAYEPDSVDRGK